MVAVLLNRRRALRDAVIMLGVAGVLTVAVADSGSRDVVQRVDDWWLERMVSIRNEPLTWCCELLSVLGSAVVMWPLRLVAVGLLVVRRRYVQLGAFVLAILTSELCIGPLKALIDRPRPPDPLVATSGASFPSGHAIAAAVTAAGLVIALLPPGRARLRWEIQAGLITFVMAMSRVYLGAHWLSDVVAGSLMGLGLALWWPAVFEEARSRRRAGRPRVGT